MIISKKELLDLYKGCFEEHEKVTEINKGVSSDLKSFADHNELNLKAIKAGYWQYKTYMRGTISPNDDDFIEISTIVEDAFGD